MSATGHPVLSCAEAAALEKRVLRGGIEAEWAAMRKAGTALAAAVLEDFREIGRLREDCRVLILAGKGHNAGDAFLAVAEILREKRRGTAEVCFVLGEEALAPLARRAWEVLREAGGERVSKFSAGETGVRELLRERCGGRFAICFDGIFGMNFRPPLRGAAEEAVRWANEELAADLRAAVDLPSGLGDARSDLAMRADFTYSTGSGKAPVFKTENAEIAGRIRYLDLGFFAEGETAAGEREILLPEILGRIRGLRSPMAHKKKFGHLLAIGGSRKMPGAILMTVLAAARSGVGLLTAAVPESLVASFATAVPEAMWVGCPETRDGGIALESFYLLRPYLEKADAVAMGPGVGTEAETQTLLEEVARNAAGALAVDAEALQERIVAALGKRGAGKGRAVLTPHLGEYARISGLDFGGSGEEGLREFCRKSGATTLLKGPPFTRICDGERISYCLPGGPVLARGGSGDILCGMLGSLLAQNPENPAEAARMAAIWHGMAAEMLARECGQQAVRTTQILDYLGTVLRR